MCEVREEEVIFDVRDVKSGKRYKVRVGETIEIYEA